MKKVSIILIILLFLAVLGVGYFFWGQQVLSFITAEEVEENISEETKNYQIKFLSSFPVVDPAVSADGEAIWYFNKTGELFRHDINSQAQEYPLSKNYQPNFVLWSNTGSDFIIGSSNGLSYYKATENEFIEYPENVGFVSWYPNANKIAYIWRDQNSYKLSEASPDLSNYKIIKELPVDVRFAVSPNGGSYFLYNREHKTGYFLIQSLNATEPVMEKTDIIEAKFSPDGKRVAFVEKLEQGEYLNILELASKQITIIGSILKGGDFQFIDDQSIIWSGVEGGLKYFDLEQGFVNNILESGLEKTYIKDIIISNLDNIFFVDETGRLGVLFK